MKIKNDVSSFKGFAVQSVRDTVRESNALAFVASKGNDFNQMLVRQNSIMKASAKAFRKGASKMMVGGDYGIA